MVVRTRMNNSAPCKHCLDLMKSLGIRRVYYSFEGKIVMEKVNEMQTDHISAKNRRTWIQLKSNKK